MQTTEATPWYRQFWPWLIIVILSWGVVSSFITLTFAVRNPPHMMTGDYATLGKALIDTHVRADRAEALGIEGSLMLQDDEWLLELASAEPLGEQLLLLAQHPTDSARDRQMVMNRAGDARYRGKALDVAERGRLIVSDLEQTWWISSSYRRADIERGVGLAPERL
ncbi:MAG: FixH family protein [Wenzhouxiangellaceae bacterium]|nr:FixH family protein [Wenzhouxiangellaceae bacterium]